MKRYECFKLNGRETLKVFDSVGPDFFMDKQIAEMLTAYRPAGFVGDFIFPVVPVRRLYGYLPMVPNGEFSKVEHAERVPGGEVTLIQYNVSTVIHRLKNYALGMPIVLEDQKNADPEWKLDRAAAYFLADALEIGREQRIANVVNSATNVGTVFLPASAWNAVSDPVATVNAMLSHVGSTAGYRPNNLIFGAGAWDSFAVNSTAVRVLGGGITPTKAAEFFRVDRVVVAEGRKNTAGDGQTVAPQLWFNDVVLALKQPSVAGADFAARYGVTPSWTPAGVGPRYLPARSTAPGRCDIIDINVYEDEVVLDKNLCVILKGCNSAQAGGI